MVTPHEAEEGSPLLMAVEINVAVDRVCIKTRLVPGTDGIPNSVRTIIHQANPGILNAVFNSALKRGVFPIRWMVAWLMLTQTPCRIIRDPTPF